MNKERPNWSYKHPEKWEQLEFNKEFLRGVEEECGSLSCEYCGKEDLVIYEWWEKTNHKIVATVDHFYPSSKYKQLKKEHDNFVIACQKCNGNKGNDIWEIDTIKFPRNDKTILAELHKTTVDWKQWIIN